MTKEQMLKIGLALNRIAMLVDDSTLEKIKPSLDEIEATVLEVEKPGKEVAA